MRSHGSDAQSCFICAAIVQIHSDRSDVWSWFRCVAMVHMRSHSSNALSQVHMCGHGSDAQALSICVFMVQMHSRG